MQQICRGGQRGLHVEPPISCQRHWWRRTEKALKMWKCIFWLRCHNVANPEITSLAKFTAEMPQLLVWNLLASAVQNKAYHVFHIALHLSVLKSQKPDLFPQNSNHYIFHNKSGRRKPSSRQDQRANKHHYLDLRDVTKLHAFPWVLTEPLQILCKLIFPWLGSLAALYRTLKSDTPIKANLYNKIIVAMSVCEMTAITKGGCSSPISS